MFIKARTHTTFQKYAMIRKLFLLISAIFLFCRITYGADYPVLGIITSDNVNVRAGQSQNFEKLSQLNKDDEVFVVQEQYSWYKVRLPVGFSVYVHADLVKVIDDENGEVIGNRVNVRSGRSASFTVLGQLEKGAYVDIIEKQGEWLTVRTSLDYFGWIKKDFVVLTSKKVPALKKIAIVPKATPIDKKIEKQPVVKKPVDRIVKPKIVKKNSAFEDAILSESLLVKLKQKKKLPLKKKILPGKVVVPKIIPKEETVLSEVIKKPAEFKKFKEPQQVKEVPKEVPTEVKEDSKEFQEVEEVLKEDKEEFKELKEVKKAPKEGKEEPKEHKEFKEVREVREEPKEPGEIISVIGYVEKADSMGGENDGLFKLVVEGKTGYYLEDSGNILNKFRYCKVRVSGELKDKMPKEKRFLPTIVIIKISFVL